MTDDPKPFSPQNAQAEEAPASDLDPRSGAFAPLSHELTRVLIVERDSLERNALAEAFLSRGLAVTPVDSLEEATRWLESDAVDLLVADLKSATVSDSQLMRVARKHRTVIPAVITVAVHDADTVDMLRSKTVDVLKAPYDGAEIDRVIERALVTRLRCIDTFKTLPFTVEHIEFVLPSRIEYLDGVIAHLSERLVKMGVMHPESTHVAIALDEAIVNAIKHGNNYDETKRVTIIADITSREARFTIADEGPGFIAEEVPDPCAPENLLRTSGRGLLLIRSIMDEVTFNEKGNTVTMLKRAELAPDVMADLAD